MYHTLWSSGWIASSVMRPEEPDGPIERSVGPEKVPETSLESDLAAALDDALALGLCSGLDSGGSGAAVAAPATSARASSADEQRVMEGAVLAGGGDGRHAGMRAGRGAWRGPQRAGGGQRRGAAPMARVGRGWQMAAPWTLPGGRARVSPPPLPPRRTRSSGARSPPATEPRSPWAR